MSALIRNTLNGVPRVSLSIVIVMVLHIGLVITGAVGVRGTDQYWYVADVDALMKGCTTTNAIYAANVHMNDPIPPPFIHNILNPYLALPFAYIFKTSYYGWIALNLIGSLVIGLLIVRTIEKLGVRDIAPIACAIWLLSPQTIWLTSQASAEISCTLFAIVAILWTVTTRGIWDWVVVMVAWGLAYWTRVTYGPFLIATPLLFLLWNRMIPIRKRLGYMLLLFAVGGAFIILQSKLFKPSGIGIGDVIAIRSHDRSLMGSYNLWSVPSIDWVGLAKSGLSGVAQLLISKSVEWVLFVAPLLGLAGVSFIKSGRADRDGKFRLVLLTLLMVGLALLVVFLHASMTRFLLPLVPLLAVLAAIGIADLNKLKRWAFLTVVTLGVAISTPMVLKLRAEAIREEIAWSRVREFFDKQIPVDQNVLCADVSGISHGQALGFYLRPRLYGFFDRKQTSLENLDLFKSRINAKWLIDYKNSPTADSIGAVVVNDLLPSPLEACALYRFP